MTPTSPSRSPLYWRARYQTTLRALPLGYLDARCWIPRRSGASPRAEARPLADIHRNDEADRHGSKRVCCRENDDDASTAMTYPTHLIPTTVVGSYPQPDWLVDRSTLAQHGVPRVAASDIWRIPEPFREQAQDDATILAIGEMERAGIDIVSDGEIRRESYSNRFALALDGIDAEHPGHVGRSGGGSTPVPRVVGKIKRRGPVELRDAEFLIAHAGRATKITLPGPFTLSQQAENAFYADE